MAAQMIQGGTQLSSARISPMTPHVEPARAHDLEAVLDLLRRAGLPATGVAEQFGHFLVVREDADLVGACGIEVCGADGLLRSVAVDSDFRGAGVGTALARAAEELARKLGLKNLYLLTTSAREFFARLGYVEAPRQEVPPGIRAMEEFRSLCPESAHCMRKRLA
jgi:amino-acid N-acetyltransferase